MSGEPWNGTRSDQQERSPSNSSSVFAGTAGTGHSATMALNGSNFGAPTSVEDYESYSQSLAHYDQRATDSAYEVDDYTSMPPATQAQNPPSIGHASYDSDIEEHTSGDSQMASVHNFSPVTYGYRP